MYRPTRSTMPLGGHHSPTQGTTEGSHMRRTMMVLIVAALSFGGSVANASADDTGGAAPVMVSVLATNPDTGHQQYVTVDQATLVETIVEGATKWTADDTAGVSTGNSGCWTATKAAVAKSHTGVELWRLTAQQKWCGTYGSPYLLQVTSAAKMTAQPNIKGVGAVFWAYSGTVDSNTDLTGYYYHCCGVSGYRGGHAEYVTGQFDYCVDLGPAGTHCIQHLYPHIWINAHYDGSVVTGTNNAGTEQ